MEQSCPTKLPFIALLMYFYVHVNTRANNGRCEWIYFSLVGKNVPPHDRNHWHNSQLPLFSANLTANSNMPWCCCRDVLHKCERWRKSDVWEGSDASLSSSLWTEQGSTVNQCGPSSSFICGHFGCQLCQGRRKCFLWKCQQGLSWEGTESDTVAAFSFCVSWKWSPFSFHSEVSCFIRSIEGSVLWALNFGWWHLVR